jgi:iron complex outermembrane recepter protein
VLGGVKVGRVRRSPRRVASRSSVAALGVAAILAPGVAAAQQAAPADSGAASLPEIRVIGTTPLSPPRPAPAAQPGPATQAAQAPSAAPAAEPGTVDRDKVPSNVQVLQAPDFDHATAPDLLQAIARGLPGGALSDQTGNQFQLDLNYRGFTASPVIGTPQGLAIYQNGVRINEVFGDTVNWDLIPENAINRMTLVPSNPIYGLNAIGGALSFETKNGFTYQGVQGEVNGGSYGRIGTSVQAGGQVGNLSGYIAADAIDDAGWRQDSPSSLRRVFVDLGARGDQTEFHVNFTGADNNFGAAAATPLQLIDQNWASVYTIPQTTQNQLAFLTASATWKPSDTWTYQALAYFRNFNQTHVDGNGTNAQNSGCVPPANPAALCFQNPDGSLSTLITTGGATVPNAGALGSPSVLGEIDRTWTTTNSFGGSLQAATSEKLFGRDNNLTVGVSVDRGLVQFSTTSELGTVNANQFPFVQGSGLFIDQPLGDVAPVGLGATTLYTGLYATDTFDVTSRLAITAGARLNFAQIDLTDQLGNDALLNGDHSYLHFNPMVGATYKVTPNVTLYGDFAETNRAPTPLELGCSDPQRPCLIDNALVGDPTLQQVVTYTFEAGLRGHADLAPGRLNWSVGAYHALNTNDIINVASPLPGHEFFQNAGDTLRQGVEAAATYQWDRWNVYANFAYVDATFRDALTLSSPFNPFADANGNIFVTPGDRLTGVPDFRFKAGADYQVTKPWKIGADLYVIGSQYLVGDESNQLPKVPAYWVVNLHSSYKVTDNVEVFGLVRNVFDQHYYAFGTLFDVTSFPYLNLTDPRTFIPGMPLAFYLGVRGTMPDVRPALAAQPASPLPLKAQPTTTSDWTGLYLGVNAGYSFGASDWSDSTTGQSTGMFGIYGFLFGGTLGANYQLGALVLGLEGDAGWSKASGFGTFTATPLCAGGCNTSNGWLATARGRVGYAFGRFLAYGTGGAAFGNVQAGFSNDALDSVISVGWTVGGGIEAALTPQLSLKAEYLFVDLPGGTCTADCAIQNPNGPALIPDVAVKFNESIVRIGVNYKFAK